MPLSHTQLRNLNKTISSVSLQQLIDSDSKDLPKTLLRSILGIHPEESKIAHRSSTRMKDEKSPVGTDDKELAFSRYDLQKREKLGNAQGALIVAIKAHIYGHGIDDQANLKTTALVNNLALTVSLQLKNLLKDIVLIGYQACVSGDDLTKAQRYYQQLMKYSETNPSKYKEAFDFFTQKAIPNDIDDVSLDSLRHDISEYVLLGDARRALAESLLRFHKPVVVNKQLEETNPSHTIVPDDKKDVSSKGQFVKEQVYMDRWIEFKKSVDITFLSELRHGNSQSSHIGCLKKALLKDQKAFEQRIITDVLSSNSVANAAVKSLQHELTRKLVAQIKEHLNPAKYSLKPEYLVHKSVLKLVTTNSQHPPLTTEKPHNDLIKSLKLLKYVDPGIKSEIRKVLKESLESSLVNAIVANIKSNVDLHNRLKKPINTLTEAEIIKQYIYPYTLNGHFRDIICLSDENQPKKDFVAKVMALCNPTLKAQETVSDAAQKAKQALMALLEVKYYDALLKDERKDETRKHIEGGFQINTADYLRNTESDVSGAITTMKPNSILATIALQENPYLLSAGAGADADTQTFMMSSITNIQQAVIDSLVMRAIKYPNQVLRFNDFQEASLHEIRSSVMNSSIRDKVMSKLKAYFIHVEHLSEDNATKKCNDIKESVFSDIEIDGKPFIPEKPTSARRMSL